LGRKAAHRLPAMMMVKPLPYFVQESGARWLAAFLVLADTLEDIKAGGLFRPWWVFRWWLSWSFAFV
jgi:hypothetical protein